MFFSPLKRNPYPSDSELFCFLGLSEWQLQVPESPSSRVQDALIQPFSKVLAEAKPGTEKRPPPHGYKSPLTLTQQSRATSRLLPADSEQCAPRLAALRPDCRPLRTATASRTG